MVQALFPPPAVGLVAPEAVFEGSPRKLFWFSVYAGYYSTKAWWFSKTTNNHRASIYTVRSDLHKFIAPCCTSKQRTLKNILQNLFNKLPPHTVHMARPRSFGLARLNTKLLTFGAFIPKDWQKPTRRHSTSMIGTFVFVSQLTE